MSNEDIELKVLKEQTIYSGDWNESSADLLESWLQKCKKHAKLHIIAAKKKQYRGRMLSIPTIVCGVLASALSFYISGKGCDGTYLESKAETLQILSSSFTSIATILTSINTLYSFAQSKEKHINAASRFTALSQTIALQLHLPLKRKSDIEVLLTSVTDQYANILNSSPMI